MSEKVLMTKFGPDRFGRFDLDDSLFDELTFKPVIPFEFYLQILQDKMSQVRNNYVLR